MAHTFTTHKHLYIYIHIYIYIYKPSIKFPNFFLFSHRLILFSTLYITVIPTFIAFCSIDIVSPEDDFMKLRFVKGFIF